PVRGAGGQHERERDGGARADHPGYFLAKIDFGTMQCTPLRMSTTWLTRQSPTIDVSAYASSRLIGTVFCSARNFTVSRVAIFIASLRSSSNPIMIQWVVVSARGHSIFMSLRTTGWITI